MKTFSALLPCASALVLLALPSRAAIYVIEPDGTGDFPFIQDALDAADSGDVVELADGIFSSARNKNLDYQGKALVVRSQSGDPEACVIDCGNDARGFSFHSGEGSNALLENLTIRNGWGELGGAISCDGASPTIVGCIFEDCLALRGGGAYLRNSASSFQDCIIRANYANSDDGITGDGGGIYAEASTLTFLGCSIVQNRARQSYHDFKNEGGGLCIFGSATLENCTIAGNSVRGGPGTVGAAIYAADGSVVVTNSIITGSTGSAGDAPPSTLAGNITISCCNFFCNSDGEPIPRGIDGAGNIVANPLFCDGEYTIGANSPCAPFSPPNEECGLIGAWPVSCGPVTPPTYLVEPDGTGDYPTIADAMAAASCGDVIELVDGLFYGPGNTEVNYGSKEVTVRSQSGDPRSCIIDLDLTEDVAFRFGPYASAGSVLEGVTIASGLENGIYCASDAGYLVPSSPMIRGCVFSDLVGFAVVCELGSASLYNCTLVRAGGGVLALGSGAAPHLENCIIAFNSPGSAVQCGTPTLACCDLYGNAGGDWVGCIADQEGIDGNQSADPLFCDRAGAGDFRLREDSPCLPGASPCEELVGALGEGCTAASAPVTAETDRRLVHLTGPTPNPTTGQVSYGIDLTIGMPVRVRVFDVRGRTIATLVQKDLDAGFHAYSWDPRADGTDAGGVYFLQLNAGDAVETRTVVRIP